MPNSPSDYINSTVGPILTDAIAATVLANPSDPVEYLANWLLRRESLAVQLQERIDFRNNLTTARETVAEQRRIEAEEKARRDEEERLAKIQQQIDEARSLLSSSLEELKSLDGSFKEEMMEDEEPHEDVFRLSRCILYISGFLPSQIPTDWNEAKDLLTGEMFEALQQNYLEPCGAQTVNRVGFCLGKCVGFGDDINQFASLMLILVKNWMSLMDIYKENGKLLDSVDDEKDMEEVTVDSEKEEIEEPKSDDDNDQ
ncbi:hypothetical protein P9112_014090 [Eukaryota sp. TZLM1-RC]